jgi:hypothetical protein
MTWQDDDSTTGLSKAARGTQLLAAHGVPIRSTNAGPGKFPLRLPAWQRLAVYTTGTLVAVSGLVWFGIQQWADSDDVFSAWLVIERAVRTVHGSISLVMLAIIGSVLPVHVRLGWHGLLNRSSGISLLVSLALLAFTGGALYYLADEKLRWLTTWIHQIAGVAAIAICFVHRRGRLRGKS